MGAHAHARLAFRGKARNIIRRGALDDDRDLAGNAIGEDLHPPGAYLLLYGERKDDRSSHGEIHDLVRQLDESGHPDAVVKGL